MSVSVDCIFSWLLVIFFCLFACLIIFTRCQTLWILPLWVLDFLYSFNVRVCFAQLSYLELVRSFLDLLLTGSRVVFSVVLIYPSMKATPFWGWWRHSDWWKRHSKFQPSRPPWTWNFSSLCCTLETFQEVSWDNHRFCLVFFFSFPFLKEIRDFLMSKKSWFHMISPVF